MRCGGTLYHRAEAVLPGGTLTSARRYYQCGKFITRLNVLLKGRSFSCAAKVIPFLVIPTEDFSPSGGICGSSGHAGLCQDTALAMPKSDATNVGFSRCISCAGAEARIFVCILSA